jgi:hypothetical protein
MSRNIALGSASLTKRCLLLPVEQRDALLAYLMKRPFEEVCNAVAWLQQLPQAPPAPAPKDDKTE